MCSGVKYIRPSDITFYARDFGHDFRDRILSKFHEKRAHEIFTFSEKFFEKHKNRVDENFHEKIFFNAKFFCTRKILHTQNFYKIIKTRLVRVGPGLRRFPTRMTQKLTYAFLTCFQRATFT